MSLLQAFKRVKPAVSTLAQSAQSHVLVQGGRMVASNGVFTISAPVELPKNTAFLAPASDFARALTVLGDTEDKVKVLSKKLSVSRHNARAQINLLPLDTFQYCDRPDTFDAAPEGLSTVLAHVARFMSDDRTKVWACAVRLKDGAAYATNNVSAVRAELPSFKGDVMLPDYLVNYAVGAPAEVCGLYIGKTTVCFEFKDGVWARATMPPESMPDVVESLTALTEEPSFAPSDEWVKAYAESALMADDTIVIAPDCIKAGRDQTAYTAEMVTPVEEETIWNPKFLDKVIAPGVRFDPSKWPKAAPFTARGVQGVILGRA